MIDLHTHHRRCGHAHGELVDYVHAALDLGVDTIGLSDHAPLLLGDSDEPAPGMHMPRSAFPGYLDEAAALRTRMRDRIEILVGVEADYLAGTEGAYRAVLADPRIDYVLGSVHYFDGYHVYDRRRWHDVADVDAVHVRYHRLVRAAAQTGLFDVMAHIDAVKGRGNRASTAIDAEWDETVRVLADTGVAVEINTSGYRKCGEPFPSWEAVERLHAADVPLTYGSDAHDPSEVLHGWADVHAGLLARGVRQLAVVRGRRREMVAIDAARVQSVERR
ncbi:histidinol-phosphatase [soil metagenome]